MNCLIISFNHPFRRLQSYLFYAFHVRLSVAFLSVLLQLSVEISLAVAIFVALLLIFLLREILTFHCYIKHKTVLTSKYIEQKATYITPEVINVSKIRLDI